MNDARHTQGRLKAFNLYATPEIRDQDDEFVAHLKDGGPRSVSNARRLVACWNACDGVPTADLEQYASLDGCDNETVARLKFIIGLTRQRDELLVALEAVLATHSAERKAELSLSTATENYSDHNPELDAYTEAAVASSKAEADARAVIAKVRGAT